MSKIRTDNIVNRSGVGAPTIVNGVVVAGIATFSSVIDASAGLQGDVIGNLTGIANAATNADSANTAQGLTGTPDIVVGVASVTSLKNHNYLQAPFGSTVTLNVTVAGKDSSHRYNGQGSGNGYKIDGVFAPYLTLSPGRTYKFNQADSTNDGHPIIFTLEAYKDGRTEYTANVTYYADGVKTTSAAYNTDFNAATDRYTQITLIDSTPTVLHYQCYNHAYMGNSVNSNSNGGTFASALVEKCNYDNTTSFGSAAEYNHDVLTHGNFAYYAQNSAGSWIYNIRGDGSTSLNDIMSVGQSISITYITTQTNTAHYQTSFKIDGSANTPEWQGGTAPSAGTATGFDVYTLTIIKTGDATFKTFAALTNNN